MWCGMAPIGRWWPVCLRARRERRTRWRANGIDAEGSEIILRREIQAGGKGRVYVNNQPATVNVLRQLAPELALVHAQSETMGSFDQAQQRQLLDRSAGITTERVAAAFQEWSEICARLSRLEGDEQARLREADLWSFQKNEIESAAIREREDEELEIERRVLANAEKLLAAAMSAHELLYESDRSAEAALRAAVKNLEELARYDPQFAEAVQQVKSARAVVEDVSATVRDYASRIQASPDRLAELEDRLEALNRLKRKYGLDAGAGGGSRPGGGGETGGGGEPRPVAARAAGGTGKGRGGLSRLAAAELTAERTAAARKLEKLAEAHINDLAMKARFAVQVDGTRSGEPLDPAGLGFRRLPDRHQCGGAVKAVGANRLRRRVVPRDAGAQGECRGRGGSRAGKRGAKRRFLVPWSSTKSTLASVAGPRRQWGRS